MSELRIQVALERDSLLPEDRAVNVFHFLGDGDFVLDTSVTPVVAAIEAFYDGLGPTLSSKLTATAIWTAYDLNLPPPRAPIAEGTFTFPTNSGSPHPEEVAICLSYQATPESGEVQARRRGRIFLGPLAASTSDTAGTSVRVAAGTRTTIAGLATTLMTGSYSTQAFRWAVRSSTTGEMHVIEEGWIDDTFDTQRRRGPATTARTVF